MALFRLLLFNRTTNLMKLSPTKKWPQILWSSQSQCLSSSSVGHKLDSVKDIKQRALKNLNVDPEVVRMYGKEMLIYESTRHDYYRIVGVIGLFTFIILVFAANIGIIQYKQKLKERLKSGEDVKAMNWILRLIVSDEINKISVFFIISGHLILSASVIFCVRTVNYMSLIRNPSGVDKVRIYCYSVFGLPNTYHKHEFLVTDISALRPRIGTKHRYIPLKIKGEALKYRIDKRGNFSQPTVFDETVGVMRKL